MIPVRLELQGYLSYRDKQVIEFDRLNEAGLFGIFGGVGSGKSGILEAITYCLYGKLERLNQRENINYNLMNLQSNEMKLLFEFRVTGTEETGRDQLWRVRIRNTRNRKRPQEVTSKERVREIYLPEEDRWEPRETDLNQVVGLSYENFRRSIIIPQGKFREFLELSNTDRTKMISELFGLNKFNYTRELRQLVAQNNEEITSLKSALETLGPVSGEEITVLKKQLKQAEKNLERARTAAQKLEKQFHEQEELAGLADQLEAKESRQEKLAKIFDESRAERQSLEIYRLARRTELPELRARVRGLSESCQKQAETLEELELALKPRAEEYEQLQTSLEEKQTELKKREEGSHQEIEDLKLGADMAAWRSGLEGIRERMSDAKKKTDQLEKERARVGEEQTTIQNRGTQLGRQILEIQSAGQLRHWLQKSREELNQGKQALAENDRQRENLNGILSAYQPQRAAFERQIQDTGGSLTPFPGPDAAVADYQACLTADGQKIQAALEHFQALKIKLENALAGASREEWLREFRREIEEHRDNCLVCGAKPDYWEEQLFTRNNADPEGSSGPEGDLPRIRETVDFLQRLELVCQETIRSVDNWQSGARERQKELEGDWKSLRERLMNPPPFEEMNQPEKELNLPENGLPFYQNPPEISSNVTMENYRLSETRLRELADWLDEQEARRIQRDELRDEWKKLNEKEANYRQELEQIQVELKPLEKEQNRLEGLFDNNREKLNPGNANNLTNFLQPGERALREMAEKLERDLKERQQELETLSRRTTETREKILSEKSRVETLTQALAGDRERFQTAEERYIKGVASLETAAPVEPDFLAGLLDESVYWEERTEIWQNREQEKTKLEEEIHDFRGRLEKAGFSREAHANLAEKLEENRREMTRREQEFGGRQRELSDKEERLAKRKEHEESLEGRQRREQNLKTLEKLFRGNAFEDYISTFYLRQLCQRANQRFQHFTNHAMSLELSEDNRFDVRDNLNGGALRSAKTLSGGQMFQASLSLALALSDNIRQLYQSDQSFFFLDEGFGTQDKESLNLVFEALKSLRRERRVVGLISHVEDLQREINVHLRIARDEEGVSKIFPSWEFG